MTVRQRRGLLICFRAACVKETSSRTFGCAATKHRSPSKAHKVEMIADRVTESAGVRPKDMRQETSAAFIIAGMGLAGWH